MSYCQKCGNKTEEGVAFCSNCGQSIAQPSAPPQALPALPTQYRGLKTSKPVVGGILILIAVCWCMVAGIISLYWVSGGYVWNWELLLVFAIFEFWGFAIGLTGAICSIKRINFPIAITGSAFVIVAGCLSFFPIIVLGLIILILGILGIILIAISYREFGRWL